MHKHRHSHNQLDDWQSFLLSPEPKLLSYSIDMVPPVVHSAPRRRQQAPEAFVGTASKPSTIWVLGLLTASTAITVAVCVPPPALHENAYFLAVSCFFFAGIGGVMAAVCMMVTTTDPQLRLRHATWRKPMHVLLDRLGSIVGSAFSTTRPRALGVIGLAAASTAITVVVCVPPPALHENAYFLAISCIFFAGVGGVMSAVCMATTTDLRHRHATSMKAILALLAKLASVIRAAFSTTTALGVLGLAAVSTAMNLQFVCQLPQDLDESEYYYHLAISGVFFAGVAGVMAAVMREGGRWPWQGSRVTLRAHEAMPF